MKRERFDYDLIIVGGGPAGLTAGLYAARARFKTLLLERMALGGQALNTEGIENYPGFPEGISGIELARRMEEQARAYGLRIQIGELSSLDLSGEKKRLLEAGQRHSFGLLGVEGEERFLGRVVSFCATCDGFFFKDQKVVVVGGGNRAIQEALSLTKFCQHIYLVHRREHLRATRILQERLFSHPKIEVLWNCVVQRIEGRDKVESVEIKNFKDGRAFSLEVEGIFIFVGMKPNTQFIKGGIEVDEMGFIKTDENMETNVKGVFAAGDVRSKLLRQISTAVGDGATAALAAERYIENQ